MQIKIDPKLFSMGVQNITAAEYIRNNFVYNSFGDNQFNITVFESQRAAELLVKGLTCLVNVLPDTGHFFVGHIKKLADIMERRVQDIPFSAWGFNQNGDTYGVYIDQETIFLAQVREGLTVIRAAASVPGITEEEHIINLEISRNNIVVNIDGDPILKTIPYDLDGSITVQDKRFTILAADKRVAALRELRKLAAKLTQTRNDALYGKQSFSKVDASEAIESMEAIFLITQDVFWSTELIVPSATNYFLNSNSPKSQVVHIESGHYVLWVTGKGSAFVPSPDFGEAKTDQPLTFHMVENGNVSIQIEGEINFCQLESGTIPTNPMCTENSTMTRASDKVTILARKNS